MKVYSIWLGEVESTQVNDLLTAKARELGYAFLQKRKIELTNLIEEASAEAPCDSADERELQEVEFMCSVFLDRDGFVKDDIPF